MPQGTLWGQMRPSTAVLSPTAPGNAALPAGALYPHAPAPPAPPPAPLFLQVKPEQQCLSLAQFPSSPMLREEDPESRACDRVLLGIPA